MIDDLRDLGLVQRTIANPAVAAMDPYRRWMSGLKSDA
jgi:hypothetical protein